jgi:hypothetical protein
MIVDAKVTSSSRRQTHTVSETIDEFSRYARPSVESEFKALQNDGVNEQIGHFGMLQ